MRRYVQSTQSPVKTKLHGIPKGYLGTQETVRHVQALIRHGVKDFYVRQKAIDILLAWRVQPKDYLGEIKAIFEWVQKNVRYTRDPFRVEVLHTARRMLELKAGDCDDMTILLGAMLESIGHPIRLVIVGPDPLRPRLFSHIYLEVNHKEKWIPLDATMPFPMGWAPRMPVKKVIPITRRPPKMSHDLNLERPPEEMIRKNWVTNLIADMSAQAISPGDVRIKHLIRLLRQRRLFRRTHWIRHFLLNTWKFGSARKLSPQERNQITRQFVYWGFLPVSESPEPTHERQGTKRPPQIVSLKKVPWLKAQLLQKVDVRTIGQLAEMEG